MLPLQASHRETLFYAGSLFLLLLWFACESNYAGRPARHEPVAPAPTVALVWNDDWRRTTYGWERATDWKHPHVCTFPDRPNVSRLHPGLLASFQLLASLWGLLAFSEDRLVGTDRQGVKQT